MSENELAALFLIVFGLIVVVGIICVTIHLTITDVTRIKEARKLCSDDKLDNKENQIRNDRGI